MISKIDLFADSDQFNPAYRKCGHNYENEIGSLSLVQWSEMRSSTKAGRTRLA